MTPAEMLRSGIGAARAETDLFAMSAPDRADWVQALSVRKAPLGDVPAQTPFNEVLSLGNEGYFAERVGDNKPTDQPPMGIAHGQMRQRLPRQIAETHATREKEG